MKTSSNRRTVSLSLMTSIGMLAASALVACEKDEAPPPLPKAKTAEPVKIQKLQIPDAGSAKEEEKAVSKGGGKRRVGALGSCCAALRQNAANAPPETKGHMLTAAAACDAANKAGSAAAGFAGTLTSLLRGAGVPSACK